MEIHNFLPLFLECLESWEKLPAEDVFLRDYYAKIEPLVGVMFEDFRSYRGLEFYSELANLDWPVYRKGALALNPEFEVARARRQLAAVEKYFGRKGQGEIVLLGTFELMDGYARFDRGKHRVFLGPDESHAKGQYLDILYAHELTHVIRETEPTVWVGFGLDPKMSHDDFAEELPVIEHLFNEGYACAISEILSPGGPPCGYAYQTPESLETVLGAAKEINKFVHREIAEGDREYRNLYASGQETAGSPFSHYVWAWQWVKRLIQDVGKGDAASLVGICSKEFVEHGRRFELGKF